MFGSRADLARVTAALDRDPFADPVSVIGIPISRREARRLERELTAKFSASPSVGRTAAVTAHSLRGGQSIELNLNHHGA